MDFFKIDPSKERRILDFRPLGFSDVTVLGQYRYAKAHPKLDDHSHGDMLEICYLERGKQTYFVGQERFDLIGGDVFVTFPGETHGTGAAPEEKGVLYWMLIHVPASSGHFLSLPTSLSRPLVEALLHIPARHFRAGMAPASILQRIFNVFDRADATFRAIEVQNLVLRFLLDLINASQTVRPKITAEITTVQEFIEENIDCLLTVNKLARFIGLSESRLKARFKNEVGLSPAEYMNHRKIDRAAGMLETGKFTITEVAMRLGFSTSHHFSTVFKRYRGVSPSQYLTQRLKAEEG
jgi:AraC-like DNA-binding protein